MKGWAKACALVCVPQIVIASIYLAGGDGVLRVLVAGFILDLISSNYFETHIVYLLTSFLAEYLLYVSFRVHNRLVFERFDIFAFFLALGAGLAIVVLALLLAVGNRQLTPYGFATLCFCSSLTLAFSFLSISPILFGTWYPLVLSFLLPVSRIIHELLINKGLALYCTGNSLFTTGFGVTNSDEVGNRGMTMHTGLSQVEKTRKWSMLLGGLTYISLSYILPVLSLFHARPINIFLAAPLCIVFTTLTLSLSALILYFIKKGLYLRELSPRAFKQGYVKFSDRAKEQQILCKSEPSPDGKEKTITATSKRRFEKLKIGVSLILHKPVFGDLIWAPCIFSCNLCITLTLLPYKVVLLLLPCIAFYSYFSSRCVMVANSTVFYLLLLLSPLFNPFTAVGGAILCALQAVSAMTEGKPYATYAFLAAEYITLTININPGRHYMAYFIIHLICNIFLSSAALLGWDDSALTAYALQEKVSQLSSNTGDSKGDMRPEATSIMQQYHKARSTLRYHAFMHCFCVFFITLYSQSRTAALLSGLLLIATGGYYCLSFLAKYTGKEFALKIFLIILVRAIFMILITLVNVGKLRHIGYRIRGSYLLISLVCYVLLFISLFIPFSESGLTVSSAVSQGRKKAGRISFSLIALFASLLLLIFCNIAPLVCTGFLMLIGYLPQGDPSLLLLTVYRGFHSAHIEQYTSYPKTMMALRFMLTTLVGLCIWASLLYGMMRTTGAFAATNSSTKEKDAKEGTFSYSTSFRRLFNLLNLQASLIALITGSLAGMFLSAPSLLHFYGAEAILTPEMLAISLGIVVCIVISPMVVTLGNSTMLFIVSSVLLLLMLIGLSSHYPITIVYTMGLIAIMALPASVAGLAFVALCFIPELLNASSLLYVSQDYLLGLWSTNALAFLSRLWFNRELYIRMALYPLVERGHKDPTVKVKASSDLLDSLWVVRDLFVIEPNGSIQSRNTYLYYWIGGLSNGFRYLRLNVGLFIVTSCVLLSMWSYAPIVVVLLSLTSLLLPAVEFSSGSSRSSSGTHADVRAIGGYFGTGGAGFCLSDVAKLQLVTNVCVALYGSIILRCMYSIIRAPFHLSGASVNVTGYLRYVLYDAVALFCCSTLSLIPFTLLTGKPYRLFACLQNVLTKRLLAVIIVLICVMVFFATEKCMVFFTLLACLSLLFEAPFLPIQKHNANNRILINGETLKGTDKNVVTMDTPAISMNV
ncbi:Hypothetical protein GLP15_3767 [Giardia lamblia P15]|uniref:Uncharacterized protein n=1 Tax=Giardia intestinalis (strain P15) TaxID=658858 RepID=E1F294_GIAIA|nr:Hypothetical protein GLP15_3767 [Giardia lamblia P15]